MAYGRPRGTPVGLPALLALVLVLVLVSAVAAVAAGVILGPGRSPSGPGLDRPGPPPPAAGYFPLRPVGAYKSLPSDAAAARQVHRSGWEPRPANARYNHTTPVRLALRPVSIAAHAYDPRWNRYILGRITGDFTGTTDEIFQWAAVKWGLPDNLIRTAAYMESDWRQSNYGDFVSDRGKCPPGYRAMPCPVTFGIVGTKSTSWPGIFPWNRDSTAAAVDVLGGWLRGCYEGWVWWLRDHGNTSRGAYHAGDIWGCLGAWYSGDWHDGSPAHRGTGENYILRARHWYRARPWLLPGFAEPAQDR